MSYEYDDELEEIRRRKMLELQRRLEEERRREEEQARLRAQKDAILRRLLTSKARERLANLRLVRPEIAEAAENAVIQLVQTGRITPPVDDDTLVQILLELDRSTRRDFEIRIKRK
ncbi:DNA-binding protein [Aeropyrum pernix K1]|uniref:DNA-binding protein APE_1087b n=1 Tax=Aeropyrum pernix (strain ATCC 700893 / DSM 11879 / JCM 9820 / NBRC 100138 / K1) TaxID=272557 RepID=Y1087_AERPE|nr:DNA-binding protein [Aeropyrum pernix]Q05E29.1 RecName: Full=DNA-binding protein APE_1087b [Aeropyrum pernix K1]BAF34772.1 DNA-binding protein [Aeropyrum pernix K1]